jgi:hypothetical protein
MVPRDATGVAGEAGRPARRDRKSMGMRDVSLRGVLAALIVVGATGAGSAATPAGAGACRTPLERWTEIGLYFGRDVAGVGEVSERQFRNFLAAEVTPRFPDGLSVLDAAGQFRDGRRIVRERTKLVILLVPKPVEVARKVAAIVEAYKTRFRQQSVLRTETAVCLSFD